MYYGAEATTTPQVGPWPGGRTTRLRHYYSMLYLNKQLHTYIKIYSSIMSSIIYYHSIILYIYIHTSLSLYIYIYIIYYYSIISLSLYLSLSIYIHYLLL